MCDGIKKILCAFRCSAFEIIQIAFLLAFILPQLSLHLFRSLDGRYCIGSSWAHTEYEIKWTQKKYEYIMRISVLVVVFVRIAS